MSYYDIYQKRLNRYGLDFQSRLQGQRERNFENYLLRSVFRVDFEYNNATQPASLERYKQDYSETQMYLLTRTDVHIPNGTILDVVNQDGTSQKWMIWWLETIESSGYNKYVVLKMTHQLSWTIGSTTYTQYGYFRGPGTSKIQDAIKSATGKAVYAENDNLHMFIMPYNANIARDQYFTLTEGETTQGFVVMETDIHSTPGVEYITVDPTMLRDTSAPPTQTNNDNAADFYWLNGGVSNGT